MAQPGCGVDKKCGDYCMDKNQVRPIKEKSFDKRKIFFKNGSCSMLLFKNIDASNAQVRVNFLKKVYPDWRGQFVITR